MANVRAEQAPKTAAVRLRAGRTGLRRAGLTATDARSAFGRLTHGCRVVLLSKGAFGFADAVRYMLDLAGPADLVMTTWTISSREIAAFRALVAGTLIRSLRLMVDSSFTARNPAYAAQLRSSFGADCIRLASVHSKIATVVNDRWAFVLLASSNVNECRRLECLQIEDNRRLALAINRTLDDWFRAPATDQWDAKPIEHRKRFEAWRETPSRARTVGAGATITPAADGDRGAGLVAPVRPLAPATAEDARFFNSSDPWGVDLARAGISFVR